MPFNVIEAMHSGLPVIASAVKGNTDLVHDGENSLTYPYDDAADAFAAAVLRLMEAVRICSALYSLLHNVTWARMTIWYGRGMGRG